MGFGQSIFSGWRRLSRRYTQPNASTVTAAETTSEQTITKLADCRITNGPRVRPHIVSTPKKTRQQKMAAAATCTMNNARRLIKLWAFLRFYQIADPCQKL